MSEVKILKSFPLAQTKEGIITISHIDEPYGKNSSAVVSIGISLKGGEPDWKAHIPYENLEQLIEALQEAQDFNKKTQSI